MKKCKQTGSLAATLATFGSLVTGAIAQNYSADWSTLSGANGSFTVSMTLSSGSIAINGVNSYLLNISNNNGRNFYDNSGSVVTSGPYTADVALETNYFSVVGDPFSGHALIGESLVKSFTNVTGISGRVQNPLGTSSTTFPIDLLDTESTNISWSSKNFGFETLRLDPASATGGTNIWDEWTMNVGQQWTAVPEPSSAILLGLGVVGFVRRRQR